jgi:nitrate reductase gamma subunit
MFYSVELQMAGVILLTAMAVGGISLWLKRRKLEKENSKSVEEDISENL